MSRRPASPLELARSFRNMREEYRQDYAAATPSRFRRTRQGLGGNADYHYRNETTFLRMREYVRDMDRNDAVLGPITDLAVRNMVQGGFNPEPQTGEAQLNADIKGWIDEWSEDSDLSDVTGEHSFRQQMEGLALRATYVDGDIFGLPIDNGSLQLLEAHRCRTPRSTSRNVVHGVLLSPERRPIEYWFTREPIDAWQSVRLVAEIDRRSARDADGNRNVFHVYDPKRVSQSRGVTAFHRVFDISGMFEDVNFANLVKQQMNSFLVGFLERSADYQMGEREKQTLGDGTETTIEGMAPGTLLRGRPGEKFTIGSGNVPNAEFFPHAKLLLTLIGINIGMPLMLVLLDYSESNFSGWRGAFEQAKMGFQWNQRWLAQKLHGPVYRWQVRRQLEAGKLGEAAARLAKTGKLFAHKWNFPTWPYINPLQDAQADSHRQDNMLASPRQIHAERGRDHDDVVRETVEDNAKAIRAAIEAAQVIEKETTVKVDWRDVLGRPANRTQTATTNVDEEGNPKQPGAGTSGRAGKKGQAA
jgi:lambda family phage portal protein